MKLSHTSALIFITSLVSAPPSFASTDCVYKIQEMFVSLESNDTVYVNLMDAQANLKGAVFKNNALVSEEILNRFHAHILSAQLSEHSVIARFPKTGADCSAIVSPARSHIVGVWRQAQ